MIIKVDLSRDMLWQVCDEQNIFRVEFLKFDVETKFLTFVTWCAGASFGWCSMIWRPSTVLFVFWPMLRWGWSCTRAGSASVATTTDGATLPQCKWQCSSHWLWTRSRGGISTGSLRRLRCHFCNKTSPRYNPKSLFYTPRVSNHKYHQQRWYRPKSGDSFSPVVLNFAITASVIVNYVASFTNTLVTKPKYANCVSGNKTPTHPQRSFTFDESKHRQRRSWLHFIIFDWWSFGISLKPIRTHLCPIK